MGEVLHPQMVFKKKLPNRQLEVLQLVVDGFTKLRAMIGNNIILGRVLYEKQDLEFPPSHTSFLIMNYKPKAPADEPSLWRIIHLYVPVSWGQVSILFPPFYFLLFICP